MPNTIIPQARPLLLQVPPEILDRIIWHLNTTELCNLRLTCKSAETALYFRFTTEFFKRKQFMVSEFSLRALVDISKSRLAGYVRHVHIGLDQLDAGANPWPNLSNRTQRLYRQRLVEQGTLWTLRLVPKYLSEAFSRLPNLETVVLRDFNSNRRSRDGPHAHWFSYGTQTMFKETEVRPRPAQIPNWSNLTQHDNAGRLFKAIIHGLGMANAKPKSIEVMERNGNLLYDSSFHIHQDSETAVLAVLRGLQRLHLCLDVSCFAVSIANHAAEAYYQHHLARFLHHCEALEELRINGKRTFPTNGARTGIHHLLGWLAATVSTPSTELQTAVALPSANAAASSQSRHESTLTEDKYVPSPVRLAHLANISLGMMALTASEIVQVVTKFAPTLKHLELWRIQLLSESGSSDDDLIEKRVILFAQLLKKLLNIPNLNLRHIKLGMVQQMLQPTGKEQLVQDIDFKVNINKGGGGDTTSDADTTAKDEPTTKSLEYTGSDWRHFVRHEMIPRLYTHHAYWNLEGKQSFWL
ncbi:hypothetical protein V8C37DRAFT_157577 [Trichoderma ceciliae]